MKEAKWKYVWFCFHPKFDTGTWTIASAFATMVIFGTLFFIALAFSAPKCLCPEIWEHIDALSPGFKVAYSLALLGLLGIILITILCIYGTFKAQPGKMMPFMFMMVIIEIATFAGSIFVFIQLAYIDQYLLFDNDTYWNLAKMLSEFKSRTELAGGLLEPLFPVPPDALKADLITNLEGMWESVNILLKNFLQIDMGEELNLNAILDATLKDEILILLGASKRVMKITAVLCLLGLNWLFTTTFIVAFSHWRKLMTGVVNRFTPVPTMILPHTLASHSYRSTESDSASEDYSGTPLYKMKRMKNKDYYVSNSIKSTKRLYDVGRLDVGEKFPREHI